MKQTLRRILALVLSFLMVVTGSPMNAFAEVVSGAQTDTSGTFSLRSVQEYKYTFHAIFKNEDGTTVAEQYVLNGGTLNQPASPTKDDHKFMGWYDADGDQPSFGVQTVTGDSEVTYTAKFEPVYYVFFHDVADQNYRVLATKGWARGDDPVTTSDIFPSASSEEQLKGWYYDQALTNAAPSELENLTENVHLYPHVAKGYWLSFITADDATKYAPVFYDWVEGGAEVVSPGTPSRVGYTFGGWYRDEECIVAFDFSTEKLTANTKVYAKWDPVTTAGYTVIFWKQKVTDAKDATTKTYDYDSSVTGRTAAVGTEVAPTNADRNMGYTGFTYANRYDIKNAKGEVITGIESDGSSVLNVYYDRQLITMNFMYRYNGSWQSWKTYTGLHGQTLAQNDYEWPSDYNWYDSYSSRWGQIFSAGSRMTFLDAFLYTTNDSDTQTYYRFDSSGSGSVSHYKQEVDGTYPTTPTNKTSSSTSSSFTISNKYDGFTVHHYIIDNGSEQLCSSGTRVSNYTNLHVYYERNKKNLEFKHGNNEYYEGNPKAADTQEVYFEASMSSYADTAASRPAGIPSWYVTDTKWYADPQCTTEYDFSGNMPNANVAVYKKWFAPQADVTVEYHVVIEGSDGTTQTLKVTAGETVSLTVPEREGYNFAGWLMITDTGKVPFNEAMVITGNTTLEAVWIAKGEYTVSYKDDNNTANNFTDTKTYALDAEADVYYPNATTYTKDGVNYYFHSWTDGTNTYYPNSVIEVAGNTVLTAVYVTKEDKVTLTYDRNYPSGEAIPGDAATANKTYNLYINEPHTVLSAAALGYKVTGYTFTGWISSNGSYKAGDVISLSDDNNNTLIAQWTPTVYNVTYQYTGEVPAGAPGVPATAEVAYKTAYTVEKDPELDGYTFNGWYKDEVEVTGFDMPADDVTLSGSWTIRSDLSYKVNYLEQGTNYVLAPAKEENGQTFGTTVDETAIEIAGYNKVEPTTASLTIGADEDKNVITFYYTKRTDLSYKVNYLEQGTNNVLATAKEVGGQTFGATVDETAIEIAGYNKVEPTTASLTIGADEDKNVITFYYTKRTDLSYTVNYLEKDTNAVLAEAKTVNNQTYKARVTEEAIEISGYDKVEPTSKTIEIEVENYVINFYYEKADFTVSYAYDSNYTVPADAPSVPASVSVTYKDTYNVEEELELAGYTFSGWYYDGQIVSSFEMPATNVTLTGYFVADDATEYTVEFYYQNNDGITYPESATSSDVRYGKTDTTASVKDTDKADKEGGKYVLDTAAANVMEGNIAGNGSLVLKLYFKLNTSTYTIHHYLHNTEVKVADDEVGTAKIDDTINASASSKLYSEYAAAEVSSYDPAKSITIKVAADDNVITVYYKVALRITADSDSKTYDAKPLTDSGFTAEGLVNGDTKEKLNIVMTAESTITNVGSIANVIDEGKATIPGYYVPEYVNGTLTITKATVTVTADDKTKVYGEADPQLTATVEGLLGTDTVAYTLGRAAGEDVDTYAITPNGETVQGNYTVTYEPGTLEIAPRKVTLTSETASKVYDGAPLTRPDVTVTGDGFVAGEVSDIKAVGTITTEGSVPNTIEYTKNASSYKDSNYVVTLKPGTLTINTVDTEVVVTIVGNHDSKVYDGQPHTITGYEVTEISDSRYKKENIAFTGTASATRTDVGTTIMGLNDKSIAQFTNTSENFTNVTFNIIDGYMNITPVTDEVIVTIKGNSVTTDYDGEPHTATGYSIVSISNSLYSSQNIRFTGTDTVTRTDAGTTNMGLVGKFENTNTNFARVTFVVEDGFVTINPIDVTVEIVGNNDTVTYDGAEHTVTGYEATADTELYDVEADIKFSGNDEVKGTNVDTYDMGLADDQFENINPNFATVTFVVTDGYLTIEKKALTITADSAEKVYDGEELTKDSYTDSGLAEGDTFESVTVTGSQLYVGTSDNVASDAIIADENGEDATANYEIEYVNGTLTVTEPSDHSLVIVKTHEGREYKVGETVEFVITVKNIFADARTITISEIEGVTITGESVFEAVEPGAEVETTAEYVITDEDVINEGFTNTAYATFSGSDTVYEAEDEVATVDATSEIQVIKTETSKPAGENGYALGETITYTLVVKNNANLTINDIVLVDELVGLEGEEIGTLKMGESSEAITVEYVVTSDDILAGEIKNVAAVTGTDAAGETVEDTDEVTVEADDLDATLSVIKSSNIAEGDTVSLGEVITYTIVVKNEGNVPFTNVEVVDDMTGASWTIEVLGVGEEKTFTTTYTVTSADILAGEIVNTVTAEGDPIPDPKNPEDPKTPEDDDNEKDEPDDINDKLTVIKTSNVAEDATVGLGETITYTIVVRNDGNVPFTGIKVVEQLDGAAFVAGAGYTLDADGNAVISRLAVGAAVTLTAKYTVTSDDILNGSVKNVVTAEGDPIPDPKDPDDPKKPEGGDDVEDKTDAIDVTLTVTKTSEVPGGDTAGLGETIEYTIVVVNDGNVPYYNVVVTDEWTGNEWTIEELAVGASETFMTSYTVDSDDILAGKVINVVTAKGDPIEDPNDSANPKVPEGTDDVEDETDDVDGTLSVVKTSDVAEGETVSLGEVITYTIVVKNEGNVPFKNVVVEDAMTGDRWTIEVFGVGEEFEFETSYTVTSDDILAGKVVNNVTAKGDPIPDPKNPDPVDPKDDDEEEDETDDLDFELEVIKTSDVAEGTTVGLGETINYEITVTNKGNVPYYNVVVTDEWTGDSWTIAELAVGASASFTAKHVVTEDDLIKGSVLNEVVAKADPIDDPKDPTNPKTPEDDDDVEDPTDATTPSLFVEKKTVSKPANGESYALGETISYEITVLNNGNLTITDIVVTDEKTGDVWTIDKLEVGEMSIVLKAEYVVTEDDILAGSVVNEATASGKTEDPNNPEPNVTPGKVEDPTDEPDPDFEITKTLVNLPEKGYFTVGEKAVYEVVVENVGNLTLTDIVVTEELADAVFVSADDARATVNGMTASISALKPGEAITLTAEYTIKIEDLSTDLKNCVTGTGKGPKDDPDDEDDEEKTPVDELIKVEGNKIWDDVDNAYSTKPESITVHLLDDGAEIRETMVTEADGWKFCFEQLPKHNTDGSEIVYSLVEDAITGYNVTYAEEGYDITNSLIEYKLTINYWYYEIGGDIAYVAHESMRKYGEPYDVASPSVIGHSPDITNIVGVMTEDASYDVIYTRNLYRLIVDYLYLDGTDAFPRIYKELYYGDPYEFTSPELEGYTPNYEVVKGTMPADHRHIRVIYVPNETDTIIDEYNVPLGVGTVEMNCGECFE